MKKFLINIITFIFISSGIWASADWSIGTAETVPENKIEIGLFQPLQYGYSKDIELSVYPLWMFLMPNLTLKKAWPDLGPVSFASEHTLYYPTPLLDVIAKEGAGGILPATSKVPHIFVFINGVYFTYEINSYLKITPSLFLYLSGNLGEKDFPTIDFMMAYHRTSVYHNNVSGRFGLDFDGNIIYNLDYNIDVDYFILNDAKDNWALEHSLMLSYRFTKGFRILAGYKYAISSVPYDKEKADSLFFPLIDFQWSVDF
ncbi:MAG: hypothetical protein OEZ13_05940 [Spirochaetia bacterium]|nr:hypothetical protein [Spirochaetia bacterium]